mgnify:CR=1 FL=1
MRPPAAATTATHCLPLSAGSLLMLAVISRAAPFFAYMAMLSAFHMCEYLLTAAFRPDTLSFDNFLLNHSPAYQIMVAVCWLEYWAEFALVQGALPGCKAWGLVSSLGLCMCLVGLLSRAVKPLLLSQDVLLQKKAYKVVAGIVQVTPP